MCIGWVCGCAGLFCLWETRWNYFTSLYFFCISLSTIGLGDVVPDHPRMLILMFWLVIIGLSIVSMLLSVIQIKMEEWLYHLMIKMQKEYRRAIESGNPVDKERIIQEIIQKQPFFMREIAPHLISETQAEKLNQQAETFEKVTRVTNNKNIQTDTLENIVTHEIATSPQSDHHDDNDDHLQSQHSVPGIEVQTSEPLNAHFVDAGTSIMSRRYYQMDEATSDHEEIFYDL